MHIQRPRTTAFSLVELSIVLVILGLLTGGILAGQSLIRASEMRAVTTEKDRYLTAIGAFRDKYMMLPGDFSTSQFGTAGWIGFGNGNGILTSTGTATTNEDSLFWIHLANAGLIEGSYTNYDNSGTPTIGTNIPRSKANKAGWTASYLGTMDVSWLSHYPSNYGNIFFFGSGIPMNPTGVLKPEEAWNIDTKVDDGRPDQGNVLTFESHSHATTGCSNPGPSSTAQTNVAYDLDNTSTTACAFLIKTGY